MGGVAGVALVVGLSPFTIDVPFIAAVLACLAAAFAYGIGANLVKVRFAGEPPLALAIGQQLAAAVVLLPLIPIVPVRAAPDAVDIACLLGLALALHRRRVPPVLPPARRARRRPAA